MAASQASAGWIPKWAAARSAHGPKVPLVERQQVAHALPAGEDHDRRIGQADHERSVLRDHPRPTHRDRSRTRTPARPIRQRAWREGSPALPERTADRYAPSTEMLSAGALGLKTDSWTATPATTNVAARPMTSGDNQMDT